MTEILFKGGSLAKSRKLLFSGEVIFGGQNPKNAKKNSKNYIVPNHLLGHTDHLYTYKGHVEHVGFTEKRQKLSKLTIWALFWLKMANFDSFWRFSVKPTSST